MPEFKVILQPIPPLPMTVQASPELERPQRQGTGVVWSLPGGEGAAGFPGGTVLPEAPPGSASACTSAAKPGNQTVALQTEYGLA